MLQVFAGDPFLARRSALRALAERRSTDAGLEVVRLGEGLEVDRLREALGQGGLFGAVLVFVDLDEAYAGGANVERTAAIDALAAAAASADAIVVDAAATPARQRRWRDLGRLEMLATPRYAQLQRWIAQELREAGVAVRGDVAGALADLFGDDLPGIAGEVEKLALLDGAVTPERAREVAQRPAARSAFDLVDAIAAGDAAAALRIARGLTDLGEAPVRVMAALTWQLDLVARCAALALRDPAMAPEVAARELGASPYPTRKAWSAAAGLDEATLAEVVARAVDADVAMKTGRDPVWALESAVLDLARQFAAARPAPRSRQGPKAR